MLVCISSLVCLPQPSLLVPPNVLQLQMYKCLRTVFNPLPCLHSLSWWFYLLSTWNTISTLMIPNFLSSAQNSPLLYPTASLTSPLECLTGISNFRCPKPEHGSLSPNFLLLMSSHRKGNSILLLTQAEKLGVLCDSALSFTSHSHPPSKSSWSYTQNILESSHVSSPPLLPFWPSTTIPHLDYLDSILTCSLCFSPWPLTVCSPHSIQRDSSQLCVFPSQIKNWSPYGVLQANTAPDTPPTPLSLGLHLPLSHFLALNHAGLLASLQYSGSDSEPLHLLFPLSSSSGILSKLFLSETFLTNLMSNLKPESIPILCSLPCPVLLHDTYLTHHILYWFTYVCLLP